MILIESKSLLVHSILFLFFLPLSACMHVEPKSRIANIVTQPEELVLDLGDCVRIVAAAVDEDGRHLFDVSQELVSEEPSILRLAVDEQNCRGPEQGLPFRALGAGKTIVRYQHESIENVESGVNVSVNCPMIQSATFHPENTISETVMWKAEDSPHIVNGNITIEAGGELILQSCANIELDSSVILTVRDGGILRSLGAGCDPIAETNGVCSPLLDTNGFNLGSVKLSPRDGQSQPWGGISLRGGYSKSQLVNNVNANDLLHVSEIRYTVIEDAGNGLEGAIVIQGNDRLPARPTIFSVSLVRPRGYGVVLEEYAALSDLSGHISSIAPSSGVTFLSHPASVHTIPLNNRGLAIHVTEGIIDKTVTWNHSAYQVLGTITVSGKGEPFGTNNPSLRLPPTLTSITGSTFRFASATKLAVRGPGRTVRSYMAGQRSKCFSGRYPLDRSHFSQRRAY